MRPVILCLPAQQPQWKISAQAGSFLPRPLRILHVFNFLSLTWTVPEQAEENVVQGNLKDTDRSSSEVDMSMLTLHAVRSRCCRSTYNEVNCPAARH